MLSEKREKLNKLVETTSEDYISLTNDEIFEKHLIIRELLEEHQNIVGYVEEELEKTCRHEKILRVFEENLNGQTLVDVEATCYGGYRLVSAMNIEENHTFLQIPISSTFSLDNVEQIGLYKNVLNAMRNDGKGKWKFPENCVFAFFVLMEFYRGSDSLIYDYLRSLPLRFENVTELDVDIFKKLKDCNFFRSVVNLWNSLVRQYVKIFTFLNYNLSGVEDFKQFLNETRVLERFCLTDYWWCVSVVITRVFPVGKFNGHNLYLIPLLDLCDHSCNGQKPYFDIENQTFVGKTCSKLTKGQPVYICYQSNLSLFDSVFYHGFLCDDYQNYLLFDLPISKIDATKQLVINKYSLNNLRTLCFPRNDPWSGLVRAYLRILAANNHEMSLLTDKANDLQNLSSLKSDKGLNEKNESLALFITCTRLKQSHSLLNSIIHTTCNDIKNFPPKIIAYIEHNMLLIDEIITKLKQNTPHVNN